VDLTFLFPYVLFLHVFGAILAFGPTYAFRIIGAAGGAEPQHANFASRVTEAIGTGQVYPLAILQGITGVLLLLLAKVNLLGTPWLLLGIALYLVALVYALTIQRNTLHDVIEMSSAPPPADAPPGPPPALLAAVKKGQRGGIFLGAMIAVIVFLMVVKPGA
jgi:uncharacterized membrane protein